MKAWFQAVQDESINRSLLPLARRSGRRGRGSMASHSRLISVSFSWLGTVMVHNRSQLILERRGRCWSC